jgi:hypothetical protein
MASSMPVVVDVSEAERHAGVLSAAHLQQAALAMRADGLVILGQAVDPATVAKLAARMNEDAAAVSVNDGQADFGEDSPLISEEGKPGEGLRRAQDFRALRPPPFHPFLHRSIVYNEPAICLSARLLGREPTLVTYSANASFPGSARQGVHADATFPREHDHTTDEW